MAFSRCESLPGFFYKLSTGADSSSPSQTNPSGGAVDWFKAVVEKNNELLKQAGKQPVTELPPNEQRQDITDLLQSLQNSRNGR